ncbi:MAG: hypothetical protein KDI36_07355 [Pseudomonadales bacterium]|nr:hypothetical protein [Pseudomonadales bacterium]
MKRLSGYVTLLLLLWSGALAAADKTFVLRDGSQVRGEIVSFSNGVYEIRSSALGTLRVPDARVVSILTADSASQSAPAPTTAAGANSAMDFGSALDSIKSGIASSPDVMSQIMQLQHDPQMKEVLSDPAIMQAVQRLDFEALSRNPKFQALMNNAKVRQIQSSMGQN